VRKCYLSILKLGLSGDHPEKLFLANGGGRNGKGVLNELAFKMLGEYAYKLSIEILTKEVKKTGANPELANLHKKRMVVSNEPEDGCKLQMGIIKELTGGNEISARGLYNGNTKNTIEYGVGGGVQQETIIERSHGYQCVGAYRGYSF